MSGDGSEFMLVGEVAELFSVDRRTVTRWANEGKLVHIRTLGGHRRYLASSVHAAFNASRQDRLEDE